MKNDEPKQIKCYCGHTTMCDCSPIVESKQQTLEEAAHKMLMDFGIMSVGESINVLNVKKLMVLFAKEQQERRYSETFGIVYVLETLLDFAGEDNATSISISTTDAEKIIKLLKQL
jgi:hypothetical protein